MRRSTWLLLCAFAALPVQGAEPLPDPARAVVPAPTLEDVDRVLESMRRAIWNLPASMGHPAPEPDGRTLQDDIDKWLLTDAVIPELDAERARLARAVAADGTIPAAALQGIETLVQREACKMVVMQTYWSGGDSHAYRETLIQNLLDRLPAVSPEIVAEVESVRSSRRMTRAMMVDDLDVCASLRPGQQSPQLAGSVIAARYDALRLQLATEVDRAVAEGRLAPMTREREPACPQPALDASATQDRKAIIRAAPNPRDYYPRDARVQGIEGIVRVELQWDRGGCVGKVIVAGSSGSEALDEAAMRLGLLIEMEPAIVDGKPAGDTATLPIRFSLSARDNQPQP